MATGLEGRLEVHVHWDGERIVSAEPRSARPVDACRVLVGRRAEEALAICPWPVVPFGLANNLIHRFATARKEWC